MYGTGVCCVGKDGLGEKMKRNVYQLSVIEDVQGDAALYVQFLKKDGEVKRYLSVNELQAVADVLAGALEAGGHEAYVTEEE